MNTGLRLWRDNWKLVAAVGVIVVLVSLLLLAYALSPGGETLRMQATLAPTLFAPLPGGAP